MEYETCSDNHEEIAWIEGEYQSCPVCAANDEIKRLESEVKLLQGQLSAIQEDLDVIPD